MPIAKKGYEFNSLLTIYPNRKERYASPIRYTVQDFFVRLLINANACNSRVCLPKKYNLKEREENREWNYQPDELYLLNMV